MAAVDPVKHGDFEGKVLVMGENLKTPMPGMKNFYQLFTMFIPGPSGCQMDRNSDTFFSQLTKGLNTSHWRVLVFSPGSPQLRGLVQRCGSRFRRGNPQRASLCEKVGRDVLAKGNWQPSSRVVNCRWQSGWPFGSAKLGTLCHCGSSVEP